MNRDDLFIKMVLHAWDQQIKRASKAFDSFTDEELYTEIAPGKNRIIYLLGHLTVVHDMMLPLLDLGERNYPQLDDIFLKNPDRFTDNLPTVQELRIYWRDINVILAGFFKTLSIDEWFSRHTMISDEDFAKEPNRNKLSVVITRTNHVAMHLGQMLLIKK
jgi:hypothetical protein